MAATPIERVRRAIAPSVEQLAKVGHVRSVEVDEKDDRVDVVIRLRVQR